MPYVMDRAGLDIAQGNQENRFLFCRLISPSSLNAMCTLSPFSDPYFLFTFRDLACKFSESCCRSDATLLHGSEVRVTRICLSTPLTSPLPYLFSYSPIRNLPKPRILPDPRRAPAVHLCISHPPGKEKHIFRCLCTATC